MKYKIAAFALVLFIVLFAGLQSVYKYHFFFIEQNQMFLFAGYYFREMMMQPGGLADYLGEFLVQFFTLPYAGAAITSLLLTAAGALTALLCRRVAPQTPLYLLYVLPVIGLLCMHFNFNYFYWGTVAFLMMLVFLWGYVSWKRFNGRMIFGAVTIPLLFWWGGSVAVLYAFCMIVWEILCRPSRWYVVFVLAIEAALLAWASVYWNVLGAYRLAFLPDLYYHWQLKPEGEIYYAWAALPVALVVAWFFRRQRDITVKKEILLGICQLALIGVIGWLGVTKYIDTKSAKLKRLDHYARTEQWDAIIESSKGQMTNFLYLNYLNMALAQKGLLADQLFKYDQRNINGLFIPWNRALQPSVLLSDIHFTIGNSAISQEMAFESYVSTPGTGSPRMLMRLIQTNLVFGAYPVAEKYIDILEKTLFYRDWARAHRQFLYKDEKVEGDPLLGEKRKCLVKKNFISNHTAAGSDLTVIAEQNPGHRTAIEYFGSAVLLMKEVTAFRDLLETYYGTEILPSLPVSFQEAVITIYEGQPEKWAHYQIPEGMISRFNEYKRQVLANRNNSGAANLLRRSFGDTYWFYYMFK